MDIPPLSPTIALRIALAARSLGDVGVSALLDALIDFLGTPLDDARLSRLGLRSLRAALFAHAPNTAQLRTALGYLSGQTRVTIINNAPPELDPFDEGDMPESIRVAVASQGYEQLDGEFGHCTAYLIYQVSLNEIRLIDWRLAPQAGRAPERESLVLAQLADCHILYATDINNRATARLMRARIHPIAMGESGDARLFLHNLQRVLGTNPPPWLRKAVGLDTTIHLQKSRITRPSLVHSSSSRT